MLSVGAYPLANCSMPKRTQARSSSSGSRTITFTPTAGSTCFATSGGSRIEPSGAGWAWNSKACMWLFSRRLSTRHYGLTVPLALPIERPHADFLEIDDVARVVRLQTDIADF